MQARWSKIFQQFKKSPWFSKVPGALVAMPKSGSLFSPSLVEMLTKLLALVLLILLTGFAISLLAMLLSVLAAVYLILTRVLGVELELPTHFTPPFSHF